MKDKPTFWKNLSIVIVVALLGTLLIASYFIPVIGPSKNREHEDVGYSCYDVVVGMNATSMEELTDSQETAVFAISVNEGKAGQLVRVVGVLGLVNAMIGAAMLLCAIASVFLKTNIIRISSIGFAIAGACISICIIALICTYLGMPTSAYPYSFYNSIHAASFVMLAASLFGGTASWFLDYFGKEKAKQE